MRQLYSKLCLGLVLLNVIAGCGIFNRQGRKTFVIADSSNLVETAVKNNTLPNKLIINNISVKFEQGGNKTDFKCNIKFIADSLISASVASLLGIEVFRIFIDQDSIVVIDRFNKEYTVESVTNKMGQYSAILKLIEVQNLLLGNVLEFEDSNYLLLNKGAEYFKLGMIKDLESTSGMMRSQIDYVISRNNMKPYELLIKSNSESFHIIYGNYKNFYGKQYPTKLDVEFRKGLDIFLLNLEIGNLRMADNIINRITIPDGYKRKY